MIQSCQICGNIENNSFHTAKEMQLGLMDEFTYLECGNCGCVQLINIPADFSKYYPKDYISLIPAKQRTLWKRYKLHKKTLHFLNHPTLIGKLLCLGKDKPNYLTWAEKTHIDLSSGVLDVGCGIGNRLRLMLDAGFMNLTGVDPNIERDIVYEDKVKIYKSEIFDLNNVQFDLIMLHHSFEHMLNPYQILNKVYDLLPPNGYVLIRIPIASSYAWRHYNINWVQLDAPRHLFLHTVKSMELLAKKAKLVIKDIVWDSSEFQFIGSEGYIKGIPLNKLKKSKFSQDEICQYRSKAQELNLKHDGDQACFYLQKII
ncbi:hypothetical protein SPACI_040380 [Sporomusa acidovorans DSM 3132]|uniref:Uncharacterized protein n=1 Tax=Sporomusa acidovorans (strain ATCC 49682 / DSM 3132 / Mol) TaxID=1123286 RepID=A0ABZ3J783_SPOA4|nr:class I SAM-dependent methyltransferase [Sporomusa acidovorans]OZC23827.1 bifunctional 3-demethylubiquinone-9 3-methyltransferase/ 2-octaprenyl-6-hydroxy phenol methylase [Sporomusa acidovorans DSM 3132]SDF62350.1 2-polyprenyl-3-methyl-5-hydroxy-6-metoxy-1,4-benzoquinol methylase [Sporomusa acidovorans]